MQPQRSRAQQAATHRELANDLAASVRYLFLRYAATFTGASTTDAPSTQIDVGGVPGVVSAPRVAALGSVRVASPSGGTVRLRVAVDELLRAATLPAMKSNGLPDLGAAFEDGERVRQNASAVSIFSLTDGR